MSTHRCRPLDSEAPGRWQGSGRSAWLARTVCAVLCAAALVASAGCGSGDAADQEEDAEPVGKVTNVEVLVLSERSFSASLRITGTVEAEKDATISAEESGAVEKLLAKKGTRVSAGQPIIQVDARLLRAQVEEASAAAALARETYERQRRLWIDEKIGSELTYLTAFHQSERAAAGLEVLATRLRRTTVRAPFAGVFDDYFVEVGEMAVAGAPIARVISTEALKVVGGVPERYAGAVRPGTPARITFDAFPGTVIEEPVAYTGAAIDTGNRTFTVEIPIPSLDHVKPAIVANIELVTDVLEGVLAVPQNAVKRTENGFQTFVAEPAGDRWIARARPVRLGAASQNSVVIEEGLASGDRLITLGQVDDGDKIRILTEHANVIGDSGAEL